MAVAVIETDVGRGMGFVVDSDGYLITNRHVVEDAVYIEAVWFPDNAPQRRYESVQIAYIDPVRDLALLRINGAKALPALPFATKFAAPTKSYVRPDDPVFLLEWSGEQHKRLGSRTTVVSDLAVRNQFAGPGAFLSVSADVHTGQSGGPVLDRYGRAVGIITWTRRDTGGGYAIPIAEATRMLAERPQLDSVSNRIGRAEQRSHAFLTALGRGDVDRARRLTSPTHARRVRENTVRTILSAIRNGGDAAMRGFLGALESVVEQGLDEKALPRLRGIVERTGARAFLQELGVHGVVESSHAVSFFFEFGHAYLTGRALEQEPSEAFDTAMRRLRTIDAARTFAIADALARLKGNEIEIERVELIPGEYTAKAVVSLRTKATGSPSRGAAVWERYSLHLRLEWGDWYVADIGPKLGGQPLAHRQVGAAAAREF
jgi:S1-C subfamily serine protease